LDLLGENLEPHLAPVVEGDHGRPISHTGGHAMPGQALTVQLTARQQMLLEGLIRARLTPQGLADRCRVVILSASGIQNIEQATQLTMDRQRVRRWRRRWSEAWADLTAMEDKEATDDELEAGIVEALSDKPRSGMPSRFSAEQITAIIALACESPADSDLPISHWTPPELAREAIKRGIVDSISPRQVDRFLSRSTSAPTRAAIG
ncbi:MAG TPA: helix-turn-helix domain-containing protein, partial [Myxococcota bacterium]|nr:helix-turn-helix domain-containing protein [Myxococcota bacterium]